MVRQDGVAAIYRLVEAGHRIITEDAASSHSCASHVTHYMLDFNKII